MTGLVYLLGAGFNCSVVEESERLQPPLARNFFQLLIASGALTEQIHLIRKRVYVDLLLEKIQLFWHLGLDDLRTVPFDIEECLTLLQSKSLDEAKGRLELERASHALRYLMLMYLSEMLPAATTPAARQFGAHVLQSSGDVLTFNYDTLAESAIESASGHGSKVMPEALKGVGPVSVPDEDLDASFHNWKRALAYGFWFDEVPLPVPGPSYYVPGWRYYGNPANVLYQQTRVLKLHGSIDWLEYTGQQFYPEGEGAREPPTGLVLGQHTSYWLGAPPAHGSWLMDPLVIPPHLYKNYQSDPFPSVWGTALDVMRECETLIVVGYSFPPTDFRTRRLFLEAFSDRRLRELVVVNPNARTLDSARHLTHFEGPAVTCNDLASLYGVPRDWRNLTGLGAAT